MCRQMFMWLKKRDWKIAKFQSHVIRIFNIWTILFWFDIYTRRCIWMSMLFEIIFFDQHSTCIFFSFLLLTFCWFYMWSFHMSYVNQDSAPKFMGAECSNQILGVNSSFTFHVFFGKNMTTSNYHRKLTVPRLDEYFSMFFPS